MCSILGFCGKTGDEKKLKEALLKTRRRGPDASRLINTGKGFLGFNRLSIMGLSESGMQPFLYGKKQSYFYGGSCFGQQVSGRTAAGNPGTEMYEEVETVDELPPETEIALVCNGEIYGFRPLKEELKEKGYSFISDSDCEILPALYREYGTEMFEMLDAEYALVLYDKEKGSYVAARDPIGIRPLYYGTTEDGAYVFASEPKNLMPLVKKVFPFPPGHFFKDGKFMRYRDMSEVKIVTDSQREEENEDPSKKAPVVDAVISKDVDNNRQTEINYICQKIHDLLIAGVKKRLDSDTPVGFLLSGGLDSSLVCGISAKLLNKPLETWAIGMDIDAIDLKYAREVADYIHSNHHEVIISKKDVTEALETVIEALGTYDITTIRASVGMYLVCKAIHDQSDLRVILTGEISDEIFGYKYTDFAPNASEFQKEAEKRIREIHMYDVLRADRCISVNSLEARVPFGDLAFVEYCMAIDPELKLNRYGKGKYLLRHAFEKDQLIPDSILWREKAAFSDAVGHSLKDDLEEFAALAYTDEEFQKGVQKYEHAKPFTKESLLYRDIFEKYYPGQSEMVADFWMPNKNWDGCNVTDPSARVLSNYGESGQ